jgi:hypothetical protein
MKWLPLWHPCLTKIYRGGTAFNFENEDVNDFTKFSNLTMVSYGITGYGVSRPGIQN